MPGHILTSGLFTVVSEGGCRAVFHGVVALPRVPEDGGKSKDNELIERI